MFITDEDKLSQSPLGKKSSYINHYTPHLLFPISRKLKREEIGIISNSLPFTGADIWNAFELSWLNLKGKPEVAYAEFIFPCESPFIIESKSFKLYLNSLNNSKFESFENVRNLLVKDLSRCTQSHVQVNLFKLDEASTSISNLQGICLDDLDIECDTYTPNGTFLSTKNSFVSETLYSHLLKSNCLVTGQPDWGSLIVKYQGPMIDHEGLLRYIVSFRDHNEFHEQCVERIYYTLLTQCKPTFLTVAARYTRRGGLDINPIRTNFASENISLNLRLIRQ